MRLRQLGAERDSARAQLLERLGLETARRLAPHRHIPALSRRAGELTNEQACDVVVGFSHGATVALDMLLSGHFQGPVVLLGISLTTEDEAAFFRVAVRSSQGVGSWRSQALRRR